MLLGDLLARFEDETVAAEAILAAGDLAMTAELRALAEGEGLSLGACASSAMRRYAAGASEEEWLSLMGAMGRTDDPGAVCMRRAFAYVLSQARIPLQNSCECHGPDHR